MITFYIRQNKHEWQIAAKTLTAALETWRNRAGYFVEGLETRPVEGLPDSVHILRAHPWKERGPFILIK
jgi:hypothetical protein